MRKLPSLPVNFDVHRYQASEPPPLPLCFSVPGYLAHPEEQLSTGLTDHHKQVQGNPSVVGSVPLNGELR